MFTWIEALIISQEALECRISGSKVPRTAQLEISGAIISSFPVAGVAKGHFEMQLSSLSCLQTSNANFRPHFNSIAIDESIPQSNAYGV